MSTKSDLGKKNVLRKIKTDYTGTYAVNNGSQFVNPEKDIRLYMRERKDKKKLSNKPPFYFMEKVKGKHEYLSSLLPVEKEGEQEAYIFDNYEKIYKMEVKGNIAEVSILKEKD